MDWEELTLLNLTYKNILNPARKMCLHRYDDITTRCDPYDLGRFPLGDVLGEGEGERGDERREAERKS